MALSLVDVPAAVAVYEDSEQGDSMFPRPTSTTVKVAPSSAYQLLKESPQRWWLAVLLHFAMFFLFIHRGGLSVAAPFMMEELGLSTATMGVLLSAFFWSYSLMQAPGGWAVDRFGPRRAYAWGLGLWSLAAAATGLASGLWSLIAARIGLGFGQSVAFPATTRAIANWFPEYQRGTATACSNTGNRVGQVLVNGVGTLIIAALGWQLFFVGSGLLGLLWLLPWLLFLRRWEGRTETATTVASTLSSFLAGFALLKHRSFLGICLGYFAFDYTFYLMLTWLPGYLKLERGFSTNEMAVFSSIPYLANIPLMFLTGMLSDWFVRRGYNEIRVRKTFMIVGMLGALLIVPAGLVEDRMTAVWLLTLTQCFIGMTGVIAFTLTMAVCEKRIVGAASGLQNFSGQIAGIIAPALTGYLAHRTGSFALAMGVAGVLLLAGIAAYWLLVTEPVKLAENPPAA